jgi:hypothetical protein
MEETVEGLGLIFGIKTIKILLSAPIILILFFIIIEVKRNKELKTLNSNLENINISMKSLIANIIKNKNESKDSE